MCGLTGFLELSGRMEDEALRRTASLMGDAIRHRGPDDGGVWVDAERGVALSARRLAIIDVSPEGHQPMVSGSGRYVIAFNGEIYNHRALRRELDGLGEGHAPHFRGHSDTETLLAAIDRWGLKPALERAVGMFAFALWDRHEQDLHLVRDRIGEKPLYYGWMGDAFLFGSELKALRAHPAFDGEVDRSALALYMRYACVPVPYSIYRGIHKLPPGTILTLQRSSPRPTPLPVPYWSARRVAEAAVADPFEGGETEARDQLDRLLREAVGQQMIADVPLGAFLSGGIDSSTVVALMQVQSDQPVKTFTIGFNETGWNEAVHAKAVARHLATDHTELYVTPVEAMSVIPRLPTLYDEPFADVSQIPTFLVAQLARRNVTVSLSGDGGDELFGGYNRYFWGRRIWRNVGWVPRGARAIAAHGLTSVSPEGWNRLLRVSRLSVPFRSWSGTFGSKVHKLSGILAVQDPEVMYHSLVSMWQNPAAFVVGSSEPTTVLTDPASWANLHDFTQRMMFLDLVTYLPDDVLAKVDRASMGVSLEARAPFLDHRVVEFAWQVPLSMKIRNGQGKWLLRQVLEQYVPRELIDRPKSGFGCPVGVWLRGPLREWAEDLLDERRIREEGFFNPDPIRATWEEHISGNRDWQYLLWTVLMFQAWLAEQQSVRASSGSALVVRL
jgi:asparagine synthase (glutamine-hydrolysing)